jgi:chromosome segregation ATPase
MSDNVLLAAMALIVGFALGWLIAWLIWQWRVSEHEERIRSLEASLKGKEVSLLALGVRLQEREANVESRRGQVSQSEQTTPDLTAQIEERNQAIGRLGVSSERDGQIEGLRAHV